MIQIRIEISKKGENCLFEAFRKAKNSEFSKAFFPDNGNAEKRMQFEWKTNIKLDSSQMP